jgi:transposase
MRLQRLNRPRLLCRTQAVREFRQHHPRVRFHFTPTYSSWLNQIEIWFANIEREVIARCIFTPCAASAVTNLVRQATILLHCCPANALGEAGK